jgi:hypothetical protein
MSETFRIIDGVGWIGSREIRWGVATSSSYAGHHVRRLLIPAENGWKMSVIWGTGTYSSNHTGSFVEESHLAEIAIIDPDGVMITFPDGDTVMGYLRVSDVMKLLTAMATEPAKLRSEK